MANIDQLHAEAVKIRANAQSQRDQATKETEKSASFLSKGDRDNAAVHTVTATNLNQKALDLEQQATKLEQQASQLEEKLMELQKQEQKLAAQEQILREG